MGENKRNKHVTFVFDNDYTHHRRQDYFIEPDIQVERQQEIMKKKEKIKERFFKQMCQSLESQNWPSEESIREKSKKPETRRFQRKKKSQGKGKEKSSSNFDKAQSRPRYRFKNILESRTSTSISSGNFGKPKEIKKTKEENIVYLNFEDGVVQKYKNGYRFLSQQILDSPPVTEDEEKEEEEEKIEKY